MHVLKNIFQFLFVEISGWQWSINSLALKGKTPVDLCHWIHLYALSCTYWVFAPHINGLICIICTNFWSQYKRVLWSNEFNLSFFLETIDTTLYILKRRAPLGKTVQISVRQCQTTLWMFYNNTTNRLPAVPTRFRLKTFGASWSENYDTEDTKCCCWNNICKWFTFKTPENGLLSFTTTQVLNSLFPKMHFQHNSFDLHNK